jgi:DMSO reductase anchor subunit
MNSLFGLMGLAGAVIGGYFMYKLYRIPARPFWNHWHTGAAFLGTGLTLGPILIALVVLLSGVMTKELATVLAGFIAAGLLLEMSALVFHAHDMQKNGDEGAVSHYEQITTYGYSYWLRNILLAVGFILAAGIVFTSAASPFVFGLLSITVLSASILGRALFYVLVIPTTMPGAFFWRNKGFVEHARDSGLAEMPQVGVVYEGHHAFDMKEFVATIRNTSVEEVLGQLKAIVSWK